jgi:hypothetical protein
MIVGGVAGAFVVGLLATLINVALSYGLDNGC